MKKVSPVLIVVLYMISLVAVPERLTAQKTDTTKAQTLKQVTIRGKKTLIEVQIDRTIVNVDNSITGAGSTVLEMMQKLPGVQMTTDGQVTLNGKSGITILLDGKPTYLSAGDLASLLNGMSSSTIQKIEIMTNPSSKYDAAGTSGIINIVRKKNRQEGLNGTINGALGQGYYGRYGGGFGLSYKDDRYNLNFNNSYSYNKTFFNRTVTADILDASQRLITEQVSDNDNIHSDHSYNPSLSLDLTLSKRTILSLSGNIAIRRTNEETLSIMEVRDSTKTKTNSENFSGITADRPTNYTLSLGLEQQIDTLGQEVVVGLDYSNYTNHPRQYNNTVLNDAGGNFIDATNVFLDQHRQLYIYSARADYTHPLDDEGKIEAGLKSSYVTADNDNTYYNSVNGQNIVDSTLSDYSVNTENINAAYINFNRSFKKIILQMGMRAEQTVTEGKQRLTGETICQNYWQFFPTLFFDYKFNEGNDFTTRLGRRTDRASYSEMVPFRRPQTPTLYFQGNPNLRPATSWHGEITGSWQGALFITLGYDLNTDFVRTLPYLDSNKVTTTRIPTNIQKAHSWNADLVYSKKLTGFWSTDNTISVYQNIFNGHTADNFPLDNKGIPSVYFSTNNNFRIDDRLSAECSFEYNSRRQLVTASFGPYSILSLGIRRQIFHSRGSITLNVNNLFQSESHDAIDKVEDLNQYSYWNFYTRSIRANFSWRFGSSKGTKTRHESGSAEEQKRAGE